MYHLPDTQRVVSSDEENTNQWPSFILSSSTTQILYSNSLTLVQGTSHRRK